MAEPTAEVKTTTDAPATSECIQWARRAECLCQEAVQREIAEDLAAGRPIPYAGCGENSNRVFRLLPDSRRFEVHIAEDGTAEIVRQAQ